MTIKVSTSVYKCGPSFEYKGWLEVERGVIRWSVVQSLALKCKSALRGLKIRKELYKSSTVHLPSD